jgi:uncharacterized protein DUF3800
MPDQPANYFFVDEAGDLTLFGRRGKNLIGTEGVSKCFMVGVAHVLDPERLNGEIAALRRRVLNDRYLKGVFSLRPDQRKTARLFHAKDDCAEVRMAVFNLLAQHEIKVQVAVRRKTSIAAEARAARSQGRPWNANMVYDNLVKTLFKRLLHKAESVICFARRGKSSREEALSSAILQARENFLRDNPGITVETPIRVISSMPDAVPGLQAVDYFLWALQRLFERGEDRYFNFLREHYRLIMDFDDRRRNKRYGEWYSDRSPLSKAKMKPVTG